MGVGFLAPGLLVALVGLPILWWLLRAIPPAPRRVAFPGVGLLLGLKDRETTPVRTPWWLLLLRMLAVALAIIGFAGPVLNPQADRSGSGPLLVLYDGGWASAGDWPLTVSRIEDYVTQAGREGRPVAVASLAALPADLGFADAQVWLDRPLPEAPAAWGPLRADHAAALAELEDGFETIWLTDGLAGADDAALFAALAARGPVSVAPPTSVALALAPPRVEDGALVATVLRLPGPPQEVEVEAIGIDPNGVERRLAVATAAFEEEAGVAEAVLDLPVELRNRVTRLRLPARPSAGAVTLTDDALRRRKVALLAGARGREGQDLIDPLFYLRRALGPTAELVEAELPGVLDTAPDVLVLADVGTLGPAEAERVQAWVEAGGTLLRFAGPRLASSSAGVMADDPLLPVRLRAGGRSVGGAMSWGDPRGLRDFPEDSPFAGLAVPGDVAVTSQVMAQPSPDLPDRVLAALEDGTPLVTGAPLGDGRVILVHVTANAEWSTLPLSGLFVQMLERLAISAVSPEAQAAELGGAVWSPVQVLDGFGRLQDPGPLAGVPGEVLAEAPRGPASPPGQYAAGDRSVAVNLIAADATLAPMDIPDGVAVLAQTEGEETPLRPYFLALALALLALDVLATLAATGRRALAVGLLALALAPRADAQALPEDAAAIAATSETVLAYVETGERRLDEVSRAGLEGLGRVLSARTAIEPGPPVAVNLETDELAFYPLLYWPISDLMQTPSPDVSAKLNAYLRTGGMIVFDTGDADLGAGFGTTPNGRALQRVAGLLDIPPLEPLPADHVLTRTFYLLQSFPGRHRSGEIWVEAAPNAEVVEGLPFRNLNDGVTPVVIGASDWAAAWAMTPDGRPIYPVGRGIAGERQREMAFRFGVNLAMYVMTGNYKSDQVHVPALLDRLGQ